MRHRKKYIILVVFFIFMSTHAMHHVTRVGIMSLASRSASGGPVLMEGANERSNQIKAPGLGRTLQDQSLRSFLIRNISSASSDKDDQSKQIELLHKQIELQERQLQLMEEYIEDQRPQDRPVTVGGLVLVLGPTLCLTYFICNFISESSEPKSPGTRTRKTCYYSD